VSKHKVYLSLGTNLGDRFDNLNAAIARLKIFCNVICCSSIYETDPWGFEDQSAFFNQVVRVETGNEPLSLLHKIKKIEEEMGRVPTFKYGPRLIDIDILLYDGLIMKTDELEIPHPQMKIRAFVLAPLAEIDPKLIIPGDKSDIETLLHKTGTKGIRKVQD